MIFSKERRSSRPWFHIFKISAVKTVIQVKNSTKTKKFKMCRKEILQNIILHVSTLHSDNTNKNESYLKEIWDGWGSPSHAATFGSTAYVWNLICKGLVHPLSVWELALRLWCCRLLRSFWKRRTYKQRLRTFSYCACLEKSLYYGVWQKEAKT